jgi:hypothetical protein
MPFEPKFEELHRLIVDAGKAVGVEVIRADDIFAGGTIIDQVRAQIRQADAVIALCTDRNPNVFFELGLAEAGHRPILIAKEGEELPFDIQHWRAQFYGGTGASNSLSTLRQRIQRALTETLGDPRPEATDLRIGFAPGYTDTTTITLPEFASDPAEAELTPIQIYNAGARTARDLLLNFVFDGNVDVRLVNSIYPSAMGHGLYTTSKDPDGRSLLRFGVPTLNPKTVHADKFQLLVPRQLSAFLVTAIVGMADADPIAKELHVLVGQSPVAQHPKAET